jgi:hypothetical protein
MDLDYKGTGEKQERRASHNNEGKEGRKNCTGHPGKDLIKKTNEGNKK